MQSIFQSHVYIRMLVDSNPFVHCPCSKATQRGNPLNSLFSLSSVFFPPSPFASSCQFNPSPSLSHRCSFPPPPPPPLLIVFPHASYVRNVPRPQPYPGHLLLPCRHVLPLHRVRPPRPLSKQSRTAPWPPPRQNPPLHPGPILMLLPLFHQRLV